MKQVRRSVLVWYSAREMYALVSDVEAYPRFLPWCASAEVLERRDDGVTARLGLAYKGVRHAFTTRNTVVDGESVRVSLVDGPFSQLDGFWLFRPIGGGVQAGPVQVAQAAEPGQGAQGVQGAQTAGQACRVELDLRYAFAGTALEALVGPVFDRVANTFVDAFVRRAEQVYGPR